MSVVVTTLVRIPRYAERAIVWTASFLN